MANEGGYVVIISSSEGVVLKGIERKLMNSGMEVRFAGTDAEQVKGHMANTDVYIIYLSPEVISRGKLVAEVDRIVRENSKRMVVIGEKLEQEDFRKAFPGIHVFRWVDRPVDMDRFLSDVQEAVKQSGQGDEQKRVLIVDDDPTYAQMVQLWLKDAYNTTVVNSGTEAIRFLKDQEVDLVLLDFEMPEMNGPHTLEAIRSEEKTRSLTVVFLTGKNTKEDVTSVFALKPDGYILKTATRESLREYISQKIGD